MLLQVGGSLNMDIYLKAQDCSPERYLENGKLQIGIPFGFKSTPEN
jgi:hypothetical protein